MYVINNQINIIVLITHCNFQGAMTRIARQLYKPTQLHPKMDMLSKEVKLASSMISSLVAMLDCGPIHREYLGALHAVCEMAL